MMTGISAVNFNANKPHFSGKPEIEAVIKDTIAGHGSIQKTTTVPARGSKPTRTAFTIRNGKPSRKPMTIVVDSAADRPSDAQVTALKAYAGILPVKRRSPETTRRSVASTKK